MHFLPVPSQACFGIVSEFGIFFLKQGACRIQAGIDGGGSLRCGGCLHFLRIADSFGFKLRRLTHFVRHIGLRLQPARFGQLLRAVVG